MDMAWQPLDDVAIEFYERDVVRSMTLDLLTPPKEQPKLERNALKVLSNILTTLHTPRTRTATRGSAPRATIRLEEH